MKEQGDIFSYITSQEALYRLPIRLNESWEWGMRDHVQLTDLYSHSQLKNGKTDYTPVKNITRPILNLQHRTEDIELKEVQIYADDSEKYHLSFLIKKYHDDVFVKENDLDTFFDELNVSRIDYGGGLSKALESGREVVPLQSISFCDQTDILSGPIGIKHFYSPDQLLEMAKYGWGNKANGATHTLEEVVILSRDQKIDSSNGTVVTQTPGKYIEVYEVHGNLPKRYAEDTTSEEYESRLFIVCFYQTSDTKEKKGVILFAQPEAKSPFKLIKRDPIYGRALGWGGAEELFESQVWINYDMIRMQHMLDASASTLLKTTDQTLAAKHPTGLKRLKPLEILTIDLGTDVSQVDTFPRNLALFEKSIGNWEAHAQQMGAANDSIMGDSPSAGTPFKLQELVTSEAHGLHEYRRQQFAKHIEEIYNEDYIPKIIKKITSGAKWLSELSVEEINYVSEALVTNEANKKMVEMVLVGEEVNFEEIELFKENIREEFKKKGKKHFIEILKDEFKGINLGVKVSVAGKSKNLAQMADKVTNIFREIRATDPTMFTIPAVANLFNQAVEAAGLNPVDFTGLDKIIDKIKAQQAPQPSPMQPQMQNV